VIDGEDGRNGLGSVANGFSTLCGLRDAQVLAKLCPRSLGFVSRVKQNHGIEGRRLRLWGNEFGESAGFSGACADRWAVGVRDISLVSYSIFANH